MPTGIRLNKYLASCGLESRRGCDVLIQAGRVEINGQPCLEPGTRVQPDDHVRVDGKRVVLKRSTTILLNKPRGLICTKEDELKRETIYALLPGALQHLHHVGRLDVESEGLLLMTNDGELTQRLMHPSHEVEKEYLVTCDQSYQNEHLDLLISGIYTEAGKLRAKSVKRLSARRLQMILDQGAKRQIRVMLDALGYHVTKLVRVRIGSLWGGDLEVGDYRILTPEEVEKALTNPAPAKRSGAVTAQTLAASKSAGIKATTKSSASASPKPTRLGQPQVKRGARANSSTREGKATPKRRPSSSPPSPTKRRNSDAAPRRGPKRS